MRIIDCRTTEEIADSTSAVRKSLSQIRFPLSKDQIRARDLVINAGKKILSSNFCLLCNLSLDEIEHPIPFTLVGPTGIWLLNTSSLTGIYRAAQQNWEVFDQKRKSYRATSPNLIQETLIMGVALQATLTEWNLAYPQIEHVLFLIKPGVHVERSDPALKIILVDGIDRYFASLIHRDLVLEKASVERIVEILSGNIFEGEDFDVQDEFSFKQSPIKKKSQRKPILSPELTNAARGEPAFVKQASRKLPFSRRQWILLGFLLVFNILLVSALLIILILIS
jgi:hypothetical protein